MPWKCIHTSYSSYCQIATITLKCIYRDFYVVHQYNEGGKRTTIKITARATVDLFRLKHVHVLRGFVVENLINTWRVVFWHNLFDWTSKQTNKYYPKSLSGSHKKKNNTTLFCLANYWMGLNLMINNKHVLHSSNKKKKEKRKKRKHAVLTPDLWQDGLFKVNYDQRCNS